MNSKVNYNKKLSCLLSGVLKRLVKLKQQVTLQYFMFINMLPSKKIKAVKVTWYNVRKLSSVKDGFYNNMFKTKSRLNLNVSDVNRFLQNDCTKLYKKTVGLQRTLSTTEEFQLLRKKTIVKQTIFSISYDD